MSYKVAIKLMCEFFIQFSRVSCWGCRLEESLLLTVLVRGLHETDGHCDVVKKCDNNTENDVVVILNTTLLQTLSDRRRRYEAVNDEMRYNS